MLEEPPETALARSISFIWGQVPVPQLCNGFPVCSSKCYSSGQHAKLAPALSRALMDFAQAKLNSAMFERYPRSPYIL